MKAKVACFTNKNDSEDLNQYNEYGLELDFYDSFEKLPESDYYIVSLKMGSAIYPDFVKFMRARPKSTFLFLNENWILSDEDFTIRDEENTEPYMYVPSAALYRINHLFWYEIEHSDAVKASAQSFDSWYHLMEWDFLEIQDASKEGGFMNQNLQRSLDILKNDIEILENHAEGRPQIDDIKVSNNNITRLVGFVNETTELLYGNETAKLIYGNKATTFQEHIEKMKKAINDYAAHTGNGLHNFIQATEKWNSIPKDQQSEFLHNYELPESEKNIEGGIALRD